MLNVLPQVPLVLESSLPSSEIAARIEARRVRFGLFRSGISGRATPERVTLFVVNRFFHNSFQPCLYARFIPSASGTRLEGTFRIHTFARFFVYLQLAICLFLGVAAGTTQMPDAPADRAWVIAFLVGLPFLCAGFAWFCWFLSRRDMSRIRTFLMEVVA
jgi:hypothetical protein